MNIYESISKIMEEVGAIGKTSKNQQQNFMYRGVDAVMNALSPALTKNKVFVVPEVLEQTREERQTAKGGTLLYSILKIKYTFYAEDGSSVSAVVIGEGMDSGDKASNKAMAIAFKYACFQVFCIPTEEIVDPDAECHEVTKKEPKEIKPVVITSEQKVTLLKEMTRTGMSPATLLEWAKVDSIDNITRAQYEKTMKQLKTFPDKVSNDIQEQAK